MSGLSTNPVPVTTQANTVVTQPDATLTTGDVSAHSQSSHQFDQALQQASQESKGVTEQVSVPADEPSQAVTTEDVVETSAADLESIDTQQTPAVDSFSSADMINLDVELTEADILQSAMPDIQGETEQSVNIAESQEGALGQTLMTSEAVVVEESDLSLRSLETTPIVDTVKVENVLVEETGVTEGELVELLGQPVESKATADTGIESQSTSFDEGEIALQTQISTQTQISAQTQVTASLTAASSIASSVQSQTIGTQQVDPVALSQASTIGSSQVSANEVNASFVSSVALGGDDSSILREILSLEDEQSSDLLPNQTQMKDQPTVGLNTTLVQGSRVGSQAMQSTQITTPVGQSGWGQQFNEQVLWLGSQQIKSAVMNLNPVALGPIEVSVQVNNEVASVHINSHSAQVREVIEQALPKLRDMMHEEGIELGDVDIRDSSQQQMGFEQHGQQDGREDMDGFGQQLGYEDESNVVAMQPILHQRLQTGVDYFA